MTNLRVQTPSKDTAPSSSPPTLPPELVAEAARRLGWLALVYAAAYVVGHFGRDATVRFTESTTRAAVHDIIGILAIALALAVFIACRRSLLPPKQLLNL